MIGEKQWHQKSARTVVLTAIYGGQESLKSVQCAAVSSTRHCSTGDGMQCKAVHPTTLPDTLKHQHISQ